jgi:hypothetical protein
MERFLGFHAETESVGVDDTTEGLGSVAAKSDFGGDRVLN